MARNYYEVRNERARQEGWSGYSQKRYWMGTAGVRLQDRAYVMALGEQIGGPVEPERPNSLFSRRAQEIVNGPLPPKNDRMWTWQVRLLVAAGKIKRRRR